MKLIPVVMSGGSGTRLWPVSRSKWPKQFCEIFDEALQLKTTRRLQQLGSPWVLTVEELKVPSQKVMQTLGIDVTQGIYEPFGRNTAPAMALACRVFELKGRADEIMGVFPADHLIGKEEAFLRSLKLAQQCAQKGHVVTLGIQPDHPATGYGYIETSDRVFAESGEEKSFHAVGFREKPDMETAKGFVASGKHFWNAGIFVFQIRTMIEKLQKFAPDLWNEMQTLGEDLKSLPLIYERVAATSIDYAVMEKLGEELLCIPADLGWSDVGSWEEVAKQYRGRDQSQNLHSFEKDSSDCFVFPQKDKVYALLGVQDLLVVDTSDALMIARGGESQKVKDIVGELTERGLSQATEHPFEYRPWGKYEILSDAEDFKAKVITVEAGQRLSYQSHERRSEHWIVLSGEGEVTIEDQAKPVKAGDYVHIPLQAKHRMAAGSSGPLRFFEVQTGEYFGEDDITRYQDDYQR